MFILPYTLSLSTLVYLISLLRQYNISYDSVPVDRFFFWISTIISLNLTFTYFLTMMAINCRLVSIREYLKKQKSAQVIKNLKVFAKLYMKFRDAVELTNHCFTFNSMILFLEFTTFSVSMTFLCFTTFQIYLKTFEISFKELLFLLTGIVFLINLVINSSFTFYHSHLFGKNSMEILQKLLTFSATGRDKRCIRYAHIFSLYAVEHPLLQTCGLFLFDWKQLFLMFSSIYSYLLILIQFDMSVET